ncbi:MAG: hypothetical protein AAF639_36965 [Chloroflexota bacterium]
MSGLAHYIEDEGISTVVVALIREHAEMIRPPRALWVPFPLGRPFGAPNNEHQQREVLRQALALLEAPSGPVLVDFQGEDKGLVEDSEMVWACPVRFDTASDENEGLSERVAAELVLLRPWYDLALEQRGRTTVGLASASVDTTAAWLGAFAMGEEPSAPSVGESLTDTLRWSAEDLKSFYFEAATAQPGATGPALETWFWEQSAAGEMLRALKVRCMANADKSVRDLGEYMLTPIGLS